MDPTGMLKRILGHMDDGDRDEMRWAGYALHDWLEKEGSPPSFEGLNEGERRQVATLVAYGAMVGRSRAIQS